MRNSYHEAIRKIRLDAARGDRLMEETEHFFSSSSKTLRRINNADYSSVKQRKVAHNREHTRRTTTVK